MSRFKLRRWLIHKLGGYATIADVPGRFVLIPDQAEAHVVWVGGETVGAFTKGAEMGLVYDKSVHPTPYTRFRPIGEIA